MRVDYIRRNVEYLLEREHTIDKENSDIRARKSLRRGKSKRSESRFVFAGLGLEDPWERKMRAPDRCVGERDLQSAWISKGRQNRSGRGTGWGCSKKGMRFKSAITRVRRNNTHVGEGGGAKTKIGKINLLSGGEEDVGGGG